jgi:adenylyltransferase/sulfurtransferase
MIIPDWGEEGQLKLKRARIVIAGVGGLGCPVSLYLSAAGAGNLTLVDKDTFELSNLNRQILGWQNDIGRPKTEVVKEKLLALNPHIKVTSKIVEITEDNVQNLISNCDVVVDALDNWKTRFIINDACVKNEIPFVHAGIYGLYGQATTVVPAKGPCLRCIIPREPKELRGFPVLGTTPGFFAMIEAMETLKLIVGIGKLLVGRLLVFNGEDVTINIIETIRNNNCPTCKNI